MHMFGWDDVFVKLTKDRMHTHAEFRRKPACRPAVTDLMSMPMGFIRLQPAVLEPNLENLRDRDM